MDGWMDPDQEEKAGMSIFEEFWPVCGRIRGCCGAGEEEEIIPGLPWMEDHKHPGGTRAGTWTGVGALE